MNGQQRVNIKPGLEVDIVLKQDQATGKLTRGIVKDLLTKSPTHPHGIKVRLTSGQVGRVKQVITGGLSGWAEPLHSRDGFHRPLDQNSPHHRCFTGHR